MEEGRITFLVVSDLFKRYTIMVEALNGYTSVYCEECEMWVAQYDGDQLSTQTADQLYEQIIDDHAHQVRGEPMRFDDSVESFL